MNKLTFEMPDMDVVDLAVNLDIIQTSSVETNYKDPIIGDWVPLG